MRSPTFSVVIPTYNRAETLKRAVRSLHGQSIDEFEIIIVDDGSSDGTSTYLASLISERCRTFRNQPNRGVSAARNRGVAEASGEFVVFLDDDDEFRPGAIAALRECCKASPQPDFLWGGRCIHEKDRAGRVVSVRQDDWTAYSAPLSGTAFLPLSLEIATSAAFTIRRSTFQALGGFDEQLQVSEDRDLFIALARSGSIGRAVPEIVVDVDEHFRGSLTRNAVRNVGPAMGLRVIERHREYLERPEHAPFMNAYLRILYAEFLEAGKRGEAARIAAELHQRRALDGQVLRMYFRHAPEFRALKTLVRYDALRRLTLTRSVT